MTAGLFYFVIIIQLMILGAGIYLKEKILLLFSAASLAVSLLLLGVIEIKVHHLLRELLMIPNTVIYILLFIVFAVYIRLFRKIILQNRYFFLISALILWVLSAVIDLLSDIKILAAGELSEEVFNIAGVLSFFLFYFSVLLKAVFSSIYKIIREI